MNELINLGNGQFVKITMLKGERGSNIATVTKTASSGLVDTYTITLTDGSTTTFDVTNGSSIASIEKTSTQGLVDTYTVTLTDGTVGGTFTVTNATGTIDPDFSTSSQNPLQNKTTTNIIAGVENGATASKTYYENDIILRGDSLYKVTDTIAQGGTIADGVNISETTLGEMIAQLISQLTTIEGKVENVGILDFSNAVALDSNVPTTINYTTPKKGALLFHTISNGGTGVVLADNIPVYTIVASSGTPSIDLYVHGIDSGTVITSSVQIVAHSTYRYALFIPYKNQIS